MQNRSLLAKSTGEETFLSLVVEHIPATFVKSCQGNILITVPDDVIPYIANDSTIELLRKEGKVWNEIVVGRLTYSIAGSSVEFNSWPIINDPKLDNFVENSLTIFWKLIDNFGLWPTFGSFLFQNLIYNVEKDGVENQLAFEYFWLTGPLDDSHLTMECSAYEDIGVYVRPEDRLIPVFSNSLFADMSAYEYSTKHSIHLTPQHVDCLGCFLSGFSGELGPDEIKGAYLDNQWRLEFYSCLESESYSSPRHFHLNDKNGHRFVLIGCKKHGSKPSWCEKRWDTDGKWFNPECMPRKW